MITKPYPAWIDSVPYTPGFSQPDFKMFDGTGDPHPHLALDLDLPDMLLDMGMIPDQQPFQL
jgi:hypothetical protein|nr:hypothetical protein Q903MT_gene1567 [Picea sitchensis]